MPEKGWNHRFLGTGNGGFAGSIYYGQLGDSLKRGFATAAQCCTLSPYAFTVSVPPGDYTLTVHDTNEATGEGVGTSQDTKDISVAQGNF